MNQPINVTSVLQNAKRDLQHYKQLLETRDKLVANLRGLKFPSAVDAFTVESDGTITLDFLSFRIKATPRLARLHSETRELVFAWNFELPRGSGSERLWSFYLPNNGLILDDPSDSGHEQALTDYQDDELPELIIGHVYHAFSNSSALNP